MEDSTARLLTIKKQYRLSNKHVAEISGYSKSAVDKWFDGRNRLKTVVVDGIECRIKSIYLQEIPRD
jgi:hypothetical protein